MKCKNCGYEIDICEGWSGIKPYHTGREEKMLPNRYCVMVHRHEEVTYAMYEGEAELTDEDKLGVIRSVIGSKQ